MQQVDESVTAMEGLTQKNAAPVEESTASVNSVDRQMKLVSQAVRLLCTGGEGDQDERRPAARLLQEGLAQRQGGAAADQGTRARPARRRLAARRVLKRRKINELGREVRPGGALTPRPDGCA